MEEPRRNVHPVIFLYLSGGVARPLYSRKLSSGAACGNMPPSDPEDACVELRTPYLMFLGDAPDQLAAKTAAGVAHWRRDHCLGQLRLSGCGADLGLPDLTIDEAARAGAKTVIVGIANRGGAIATPWEGPLGRALELGLDLAGGLHQRLAEVPLLAALAARHGRRISDVRHPDRDFPIATGHRRRGRRLLTVGTDCSVGKMYTALAIEGEMRRSEERRVGK